MTETDLHGRTFAAIDVEGNGHAPPELVELGVLPIDNGIIGDTRSWLVRPTAPITRFAGRIHGISNLDVKDKPCFNDIREAVQNALGAAVPVGHNIHVDLKVLRRQMPDWCPPLAIDTLKMTRKALPRRSSLKLTELVKYFGLHTEISSGLRPHRVDYDVLMTARLFLRLTEDLSITSWGQLLEVGGIHLILDTSPEPDPEPPRLF